MNAPANAVVRSFSGVERAAVLMMLVGEEEAAAILQKLEPDEVRQLGKAMFTVADVSEAEVEGVLDDFVDRARERTGISFDPRPKIEAVMHRALGPEKADSVLARITPPEAACEIDLLDWLDATEIAAMIEKEHPQIAAVLIANLDPAVGSQVLELLPDAAQPEILHRIAKLGPITPEAVETLRAMLANRSGGGGQGTQVQLGGTREAAKILQSARKATEQRVMPKLFKLDKETAKAIEEAMFVFDNLLDMDDKNLGTLIRNIDGDILTRALKGVDEAARNRFLGCMSARAADGIRDEMEARGPMKLSEVLEAQKAIIQIARNLAKDGTIQMGGGEDDYV
ncbi:MAG: flagellar motor switch protein FliG [Sphingomonas sp.]|uniref:Flagellar motor switch protein FliG n=1 Tax=Sphingomonas lycopersici TaxID=2951807 RepID=A0AA41ZA34_9SPHN|nr:MULTISPECIES: flagellar motor switch protein FliG [Sphingomonas]MBV8238005.1 flagellar motor switch protein FliG [Sphingomonas sp.]MCW6531363.1 flagellar motor switch protein FliG [Sphingomonas lycopersici]MCW6536805.1 flagellar motor switch protein FliG [Sphingomonas lycopersici]OJU16082.1 MAG: flagellar motor switch protein FliG [Sphingomonas sp. 66-10]